MMMMMMVDDDDDDDDSGGGGAGGGDDDDDDHHHHHHHQQQQQQQQHHHHHHHHHHGTLPKVLHCTLSELDIRLRYPNHSSVSGDTTTIGMLHVRITGYSALCTFTLATMACW